MKKSIVAVFTAMSLAGLVFVAGCCEKEAECYTGCTVSAAPVRVEPVPIRVVETRVVPAEVTPPPPPPEPQAAPPPPPPPKPRPRQAPPPPRPPAYCDPCASGAPLYGPATLGGETIYLTPAD